MVSRNLIDHRQFTIQHLIAVCVLLFANAVIGEGHGRRHTQSESISICEAPEVLPRDQQLNTYSPALCFQYGGLKQETYSLPSFC